MYLYVIIVIVDINDLNFFKLASEIRLYLPSDSLFLLLLLSQDY